MNKSIIFKMATGVLVIPIAILANQIWPLWTAASIPMRILSSPIVLPIVGIAAIITPWWNDL
jgi:hypothetical protein